MHRFFVYEEYGAKYEMMVKDIASTQRTIPQWDTYQQGLEALASSLSSIDSQEKYSKKSLTVGDLLVKVKIMGSILLAVIRKSIITNKFSAYPEGLQISTDVCRAA